MSDLKKVYQAINEDEALNALMEFKEKWQKTYPSCVKSWEENWDILSTFIAYPAEVRKINMALQKILCKSKSDWQRVACKASMIWDFLLIAMLPRTETVCAPQA